MQVDLFPRVLRKRFKKREIAPPCFDQWQPFAEVDRLDCRIEWVVGRTMINADPATRAVFDGDLQREALLGVTARIDRSRWKALRRLLEQPAVVGLGPDHAVRTDDAALAALNAEIRLPDRHREGEIALLVLGCSAHIGAVD